MRLFVYCTNCGQKIYLNSTAKYRSELPFQFFLRCQNFSCQANSQNIVYSPYNVSAEPGYGGLLGGGIVGGAIGALIGGPAGALLGGLLGGIIGSDSDKSDWQDVERFNNS